MMRGFNAPRRGVTAIVTVLLVWGLATASAWAAGTSSEAAPIQTRVALVIGNGAYEHTARLPNPANDAQAMAGMLESLGFDVLSGVDANKRTMESLLRQFGSKAERADIALVFYAGHGIQVDGQNYLLPTDARLSNERDLKWDAVPLDYVMDESARAGRLRMVLLDACRDNPLASQMASSMGTRSVAVGRGLAAVASPAGQADTMIAYATEAGQVAADGEGRNSPFTQALLAHMDEPGVELRLLMGRVRDSVREQTHGRQTPWVNNSLGATEYYLVPADIGPTEPQVAAVPPGPAPVSAPAVVPPVQVMPGSNAELLFWSSVKDSNSLEPYRAYLRAYPNGLFVELAKLKIRELEAAPADPEPDVALLGQTPSPAPTASPPPIMDLTLPPQLIQAALKGAGYDPGSLDGVLGPRSSRAISSFQRSIGAVATGDLTTSQTVALVTRAANRGDALSQNTLGVMYASGRGVAQSGPLARKWLSAAADQGNVHAQFNLGRLLADGMLGLPRDVAAARRYLRAAQQGGHPNAAAALSAL